MAYATADDVKSRLSRTLTASEETVCTALLEDAAALIDAYVPKSGAMVEVKKVVSCRMVMRALGDGGVSSIPMGATQGSMAGLGYSQSWIVGNGGSTGELYLSKLEKQLLGRGNSIGAYSPVQELAPEVSE